MIIVLAHTEVDTAVAPESSIVSFLVAALAIAFATLAFRAARKRKNVALLWVGSAFVVFAVKNLYSAYNVIVPTIDVALPETPHDVLELVLSAFDLVIMLLLFVPLIFRRARG